MKISVVAGLPTEALHSDQGSPRKQRDLRSIRRSGWLTQETGHNSHSENVTSENIVRRRLLFGSDDIGIAASASEKFSRHHHELQR